MRKLLSVLIISGLVFGCQHIEKPEKPEDLIPKETFVEILVDTYLSNAVRNKSYQEIQNQNVRLEKYIYQKYGIDSLQFAKSNAYYSSDLDGYMEMLINVENELIKLKGEEIEEVDSIKEVKAKANKNMNSEDQDL